MDVGPQPPCRLASMCCARSRSLPTLRRRRRSLRLLDAQAWVVMEAFHYRYHAWTARMLEILNSDELGSITKMEAWLCFPLVPPNNIRWDYQLAGGALMDAGCYPIHLLRTLAAAEPRVSSATAKTRRAAVDRLLEA